MSEKRQIRSGRNSRRTFLKTVGVALAAAGSNEAIATAREPGEGRESSDGWTGPRSGPGRTGATDDNGPTPYATEDRKMDLEGSTYNVEPLIADGVLYLAVTTANDPTENKGYVAAYDPETGDRLWKQTDLPGPKSPSIGDGRLYFAARVPGLPDNGEGGFYALDGDTGERAWSRTDYPRWASPVVTEDRVYTANDEGAYALDPATGDTVWKTDGVGGFANGVDGALSYADGTVFFSDGTALRAADGSKKWRANDDEPTFGNHVAADGRVYYVRTEYIVGNDNDLAVEARSAVDGTVVWTYDPDVSNRWDGRLSIADGRVFLLETNDCSSVVRALDAGTGEEMWATEAEGKLRSDPVVANGTIYVGGWYAPDVNSPEGHALVHALDAETGERRWAYLLDSSGLETSPENPPAAGTPVAADGKLYVTTYPANSTLDHRYLYYSNFFVLDSADKRPSDDHRLPTDEASDDCDECPRPKACIDATPPLDSCDLESGDIVRLDASGSAGCELGYEWDTDGDGRYDQSGSWVRVRVPECGSVTVTLRITDSNDEVKKATETVSAN